MCPATLTIAQMLAISTAVSVAGTLYQHKEQKKAHKENAEAANAAKMKEDQMVQVQQANNDQDAAQQKIANDREVRKAVARAEVAQGESGGFLNNNAVVQDLVAQGLGGNQMIGQNLARQNQQSSWDLVANANRAQSRINSVAAPDAIATGLTVAGQAGAGYTNAATISAQGGKLDQPLPRL
jgi:hypothetical protein